MKENKKVGVVLDDGQTVVRNNIIIDTETFNKEYKLLDGYDNLVECKKTGTVYEAKFNGATVELLEASNMDAIQKIERGLADFVEKLKKDLL